MSHLAQSHHAKLTMYGAAYEPLNPRPYIPNPIPDAGYNYTGSLFQGTGFWAHTSDITTARSDLGAVTVGDKVASLTLSRF